MRALSCNVVGVRLATVWGEIHSVRRQHFPIEHSFCAATFFCGNLLGDLASNIRISLRLRSVSRLDSSTAHIGVRFARLTNEALIIFFHNSNLLLLF